MTNRISAVIDVATDKAVSGLKGFKASINDADGAVGKMQAGAKSAFGAIQQHAGQMALAVGTALVTFGVKGVQAFTDLALEAGKFRDVSGATLEEASKWIAVGDDIGVSGDSISAAWDKMNKAIGSGKPLLAEYGIELKKTADGQADANATFLNAIDTINAIKDPTKKAELAAATFGKGWTSMSELIEQGSGTIVAAMGEVSDAQIIDDGELAKAKKFRESMDKLGDSVKDLAMGVGEELTPAIADAAEVLAELAPVAGKVFGVIGDLFVKTADEAYEFGKTLAEMADALPFVEVAGLADGIEHTTYEFTKLERSVNDNIAAWQEGVGTMDEFVAKLTAMGLSQDEINLAMAASKFSLNKNKTATEEATDATEDLTAATGDASEVTDAYTLRTDMASFAIEAKKRSDEEAADAAKAHTDAINEQIGALTELVGGDIAVRDAQREASAAVAELTAAMDAGELSAGELSAQQDATAASLIGAATAAADYDEKLGEANGVVLDAQGKQDLLRGKLEDLAATLAPGSPLRQQIQGYIDDLNAIPKTVTTTAIYKPAAHAPGSGMASGTSNWRGGVTLVGEEGPELVDLPAGSAIHPAGETAQMLNGNGGGGGGHGGVVVNVGVQTLDGTISQAALSKLVEAINGGIRTGSLKLA